MKLKKQGAVAFCAVAVGAAALHGQTQPADERPLAAELTRSAQWSVTDSATAVLRRTDLSDADRFRFAGAQPGAAMLA